MPSKNKTDYLGLNQWQGNEYVRRQDFVDDNLKIDTAIKGITKEMSENEKLETTNKNYTGAINELKIKVNEAFQFANSGKKVVADAIGSPAQATNTFNDLSNVLKNSKQNIINAVNAKTTLAEGYVPPDLGDATAADVLSGKTFSSKNGTKIPGSLPNRGGPRTITPSVSNQVLNSGYYSGNITIKGDTNLKSNNIKQGVSVFGITGTLQSVNTSTTNDPIRMFAGDGSNRHIAEISPTTHTIIREESCWWEVYDGGSMPNRLFIQDDSSYGSSLYEINMDNYARIKGASFGEDQIVGGVDGTRDRLFCQYFFGSGDSSLHELNPTNLSEIGETVHRNDGDVCATLDKLFYFKENDPYSRGGQFIEYNLGNGKFGNLKKDYSAAQYENGEVISKKTGGNHYIYDMNRIDDVCTVRKLSTSNLSVVESFDFNRGNYYLQSFIVVKSHGKILNIDMPNINNFDIVKLNGKIYD